MTPSIWRRMAVFSAVSVLWLGMLLNHATGEDLYIFARAGCGPCDSLKRALAASPDITGGYTVYMIDTKADPELAQKYRVKSVPTLVILGENKRELRRTTGFTSESSLRSWLDRQQRRRTWRRG